MATRRWEIGTTAIADSTVYTVAIADYLIKGLHKKLDFIKKGHPGVDSVFPGPSGSEIRSDIVKTTIASLRSNCPQLHTFK
jgi:hypothetical protein